ncbi:MAG TPA: hypothetical protein VJZ27_00865, partial [Aggregatilineales bacterium]|nr:hypothetical protein [Aggregatilineales bacterium]
PELPAGIHIQRALGGPTYSFYFSLITAIIALALYMLDTDLFWIPLYACLHNLAIFTVGAFVPLHWIGIETDGTTLLKWWGRSEA